MEGARGREVGFLLEASAPRFFWTYLATERDMEREEKGKGGQRGKSQILVIAATGEDGLGRSAMDWGDWR